VSPDGTLMATRALPQAQARSALGADIGAFLRHIDYLLLLAVGGDSAYGLWVLAAVTRNDSPGDTGYVLFREES
jgi:hypothetical protein